MYVPYYTAFNLIISRILLDANAQPCLHLCSITPGLDKMILILVACNCMMVICRLLFRLICG